MSQGFWLATIAVLQAAPTGFAKCGWKFWLLFIFSTVALWLFVFFYFPETSGIPIEEMGRLFGDEVAGTLEDSMRNHEKYEAGKRHADSEHIEQ